METIPFALSIHHFISSVGADAGFASLIGLAILVLLYFAQARETANLRGRADDAADRVHELESQLVVLSDQLSAPPENAVRAARPRRTVADGAAPGEPVRASAAAGEERAIPPAAPAGVAAPALTAATKSIPDRAEAIAPPRFASTDASGAAAGNGAEIGAPPPATVAGAANGSARQPAVAASAASAARAQRPVAAPAMGAADVGAPPGTGGPRPSAGPVPYPAGVGGSPAGLSGSPARGGRSPAGLSGSPASPVRPPGGDPAWPPGAGREPGARPPGAPQSGTDARLLPPMDPPARRRYRFTHVLAVLSACLLVAAAVAGLLIVTGGGSSAARKSVASSTSTHAVTRPPVFEPSSVRVTVLNGTDISGLAASVSHRLGVDGYRMGRPTNAADQSTPSTVVAYLLPSYRADALHVAASLKLRPSSVQPIDPTTKATACPPSSACTTAVVVTVGSDLASQ
jgi:LytR cell envelope-related transcriptional attenuator